jgi:hypothetical protein
VLGVPKAEEVRQVTKKKEESPEPRETLVVPRAGCKEAHVGAEVSVRGDNVKVDLFDLGLVPLLEKAKAQNPGVWVDESQEDEGEKIIKDEGRPQLLLYGVSSPGGLGGDCVLARGLGRVSFSGLVDVDDVGLDKVKVVVG